MYSLWLQRPISYLAVTSICLNVVVVLQNEYIFRYYGFKLVIKTLIVEF